MLPRSSTHPQPFTQHRREIPASRDQKQRVKKVINDSKKRSSSSRLTVLISYFLRIIFSGLLMGLMIILLIGLRAFWQGTFSPSASHTLLLLSNLERQPLTVLSTRGEDHEVVAAVFSAETQLQTNQDTPITLGPWITSLMKAQEHLSVQQLQSTVSLTLGFPIDEVVFLKEDQSVESKSDVLAISSPFTTQAQFSTFSFMDRAKLWWYFFRTDSSRFQFFHPQTPLSTTDLSSLVKKYFADVVVLKAQPTLAIVNTTTKNGLAKRIGEILSNWGFSVINLSSATDEVKAKTVVIMSDNLKNQDSAKRLKAAFVFADFPDGGQEILQNYRSDIVIFVGDDIPQRSNEAQP